MISCSDSCWPTLIRFFSLLLVLPELQIAGRLLLLCPGQLQIDLKELAHSAVTCREPCWEEPYLGSAGEIVQGVPWLVLQHLCTPQVKAVGRQQEYQTRTQQHRSSSADSNSQHQVQQLDRMCDHCS